MNWEGWFISFFIFFMLKGNGLNKLIFKNM